MTAFRLRTALTAAAGAAALSAAACREDDAQRAIAVPEPTPAAFLSSPALPYAQPAAVQYLAPEQGYRWAERAYGLQQAFHETPPDYAFDFRGLEPWAWETADHWAMYAEPWDDGYRYYYYEPGAAYPYFLCDGDYGYGFDPAGLLVALIDADGGYLPAERFYDAAPLAGRYYLHGRDLRNAAVQAQRPVSQAAWASRAPAIVASAAPWLQAARGDEDWRSWRERTGARELKRFGKEEQRREARAARGDARAQRQAERAQVQAARHAAHADRRAARGREEGWRQAQQDLRQAGRAQARAAEAHGRPAAEAGGHDRGGGKPDHGPRHGGDAGHPGHGGGKDGGKKD